MGAFNVAFLWHEMHRRSRRRDRRSRCAARHLQRNAIASERASEARSSRSLRWACTARALSARMRCKTCDDSIKAVEIMRGKRGAGGGKKTIGSVFGCLTTEREEAERCIAVSWAFFIG